MNLSQSQALVTNHYGGYEIGGQILRHGVSGSVASERSFDGVFFIPECLEWSHYLRVFFYHLAMFRIEIGYRLRVICRKSCFFCCTVRMKLGFFLASLLMDLRHRCGMFGLKATYFVSMKILEFRYGLRILKKVLCVEGSCNFKAAKEKARFEEIAARPNSIVFNEASLDPAANLIVQRRLH